MTRHAAPRPAHRWRAIGLVGLSLTCLAVMDTLVKTLVTRGLPVEQVVWSRFTGHLLFSLLLVRPRDLGRIFASTRPGLQVSRSLVLLGSTGMTFVALRHLQLAEMTAIGFVTPCLVALMAGLAYGQWIGRQRWAAIALGFLGVLVVTRPGLGGLHGAAWFALLGVVCYAAYLLLTRALAGHDAARTTLAYSPVAGAVLLLPLQPFVWVWPRGAFEFAALAALGLWGMVGHLLLILAYEQAPAQDLAPFLYAQAIWAILFGYAVFGDVPTWTTLAGCAIVVASGLYLLWLERRGIV